MYLYVELWNPKPSWLSLSAEDRHMFMGKVDKFLQGLGPEYTISGTCINDGDTTPRAGYSFAVVWMLNDKSQVKSVANGTAAVGWYEYFDQVNVGGDCQTPDQLVTAMIEL
jgi:hypothetical protein